MTSRSMLDDLNSLPPDDYHEISSEVNERIQQGDIYWDHDDEEWLPIPRQQHGMYVASFCRVARKMKPVAVDCKSNSELQKAFDALPPKPAVKRIRRTRLKK